MPTEPIPFTGWLRGGWEKLGGASPSALNVITDGNGVVRRRPGIQNTAEAPTTSIDSGGVDGLYVTSQGAVYAAGGGAPSRTIYRIQNGSAAPVTGNAESKLTGAKRPVFAETEALLVATAGSLMQKVDLATDAGARLGGTPPKSTHVAFLASRLLANDFFVDRSKVRFSDPAAGTVTTGHETWQYGGSGTSGFFSAEARPDPVVALGENSNEIFVWGATNLEVYAPDTTFTFARVANRDYGCSAPYSIVRADQQFAWLDHRRRLIRSNGRQVQDISEAISPMFDGFIRVDDCFGFRVAQGPSDCVCWVFPTAGQTFCKQLGGGWSLWQTQSAGMLAPLDITAHAHDPINDIDYVGMSTGVVAQLSDDVADDLGEPITAHIETGFLDHGSNRRKLCKHVRFTLQRGATTSSVEPVAFMQWADAEGQWCDPRALPLGLGGSTSASVKLDSLGVYRERNWRFTFSAGVKLALVRAEEEFEWLEE